MISDNSQAVTSNYANNEPLPFLKNILSNGETNIPKLPLYIQNMLAINGYDNVIIFANITEDHLLHVEEFARNDLLDIVAANPGDKAKYYGLFQNTPEKFQFLAGIKSAIFSIRDICKSHVASTTKTEQFQNELHGASNEKVSRKASNKGSVESSIKETPVNDAMSILHEESLKFNVQRLQESHVLSQPSTSGVNINEHGIYLHGTGTAHSSAGSVSSTGGLSPGSPPRLGKEEDCSLHGRSSADEPRHPGDEDEVDDTNSRAQYVSANCVVFTHYQGDASSVVDEHFSRALDKASHAKGSPPMSQRNFPPSFWNSQHYQGATGSHHSDLYSEHYHPGDAWYQYSSHHRAVHDYHHNMAQYSSLLLPGSRLHMSSHSQCKGMDWQHPPLDAPYSSYPTMSGLEAQVQETSKDLYWF